MKESSSIKKELLVEQVAEEIYDFIIKNSMKYGDRLPNEINLANKLGVGRSTLREAIKLLEFRNILESIWGSGTYVRQLLMPELDPLNLRYTDDKISLAMDLVDLRLILEPGVAELAAYNATDDNIEKIKQLCDNVEYKINNNLYYIQDDINFHTYIAKCSKNKVVEQIISIIETAVLMFVNLTHKCLMNETMATHRAIAKAIEEHDPIGARSAMTMHIAYNREVIKNIYEENRKL